MSDPYLDTPYWSQDAAALMTTLGSGPGGLCSEKATALLRLVGPNVVEDSSRLSALRLLLRQFESPLVLILIFAAAISLVLQQWMDSTIVLAIVLGSTLLGFFQEYHASAAVEELKRSLALTCRVVRDGVERVVPVSTIVPGDIIQLSAGNLIPADGLVIEAVDFLVSEASMTGESFPVEKQPGIIKAEAAVSVRTNAVFLGASVQSGTARILVVKTGLRTVFGTIAARLGARGPETDFGRGVRQFGYLLLRAMVIIVLFVLTVNLLLGRPVIESLLFAVALAVGLSPELLPAKANESIKLTRNENYWKKGLPYLDGIEFTIIPNRSTAILAFIAGKFDMTYPTEVTIPLLKDVKTQAPNAVCVVAPTNVSANIIVNSSNRPFDNLDIRRALALALDRKAFISILFEGQGDIGGTMEPAPDGLWAMPKEMLEQIPGYGPDINANREAAKKLMQKAGYGPDKHLAVKVSTRNIPIYRDPAVILIDQLKSIYIDGELDVVDTAQWFPKVARKDYALGLNLTGNAVDDPDQSFYENYSCGSERNYTNYCNKDIEKLFDEQSQETDVQKRKKLVWEIDKKLQEDVARPIIFHSRQGTCWQPYVKGVTIMVNSSFNGYRYEDVWLNK